MLLKVLSKIKGYKPPEFILAAMMVGAIALLAVSLFFVLGYGPQMYTGYQILHGDATLTSKNIDSYSERYFYDIQTSNGVYKVEYVIHKAIPFKSEETTYLDAIDINGKDVVNWYQMPDFLKNKLRCKLELQ